MYYLIKWKIRDGENEYYELAIIEPETVGIKITEEKEYKKQEIFEKTIKAFYGEKATYDDIDEVWILRKDYRHLSLYILKEISREETELLVGLRVAYPITLW